ncbi:MAG: endolytic transglycosylase MltG [Bacillota bacterium]
MVLTLAAVAALAGTAMLNSPVDARSTEQVVIQVAPGASTNDIAAQLKQAGLIRSRTGFRVLIALRRADGHLRAGEYQFGPNLPMRGIIDRMIRGQVVTYPFTIPEGYTVVQIADLLTRKGFADPVKLKDILGHVTVPFTYAVKNRVIKQPYEGYLFPDTYQYYKGMTEEALVAAMLSRFQANFNPDLQARAAELKMTIPEVVTLASIIEREARVPEERPIISAVYHNRLKFGMKLDADPTVRYALDKPGDIVTFKDLEVNSPYNTYKNAGLPPGPIANPGLASIKAALYPADVPYLYFVAKNDGTGAHAFSRTLAEHVRAVQKYSRSSGN